MGIERYSTAQVIEALQVARGIKTDAAKILRCTRHTIENYIKRHPTVAKAYREQRETLVDLAEGKLIGKVDADEWPAIKFVLVTLGKTRGYVERQEVTGAEGGPLMVGTVQLTETQQKRALEQLATIHAKTTGETDIPLPES